MTLMSLGGFALTSDHTHLVHQRDTLKAATDAASFATSRHWQQALGHLTDDDDIKNALRPIAERYILANIPENRREKAETTLTVELVLHHGTSMVDVNATANLGGVIFSGWMLDATTEVPTTMRVETRTERVESESGIIEVALALDVTGSMRQTISGRSGRWAQGQDSRMTIVKRAAQDLVDILTATGSSVAIGVVPWDFRVRLDATMRTRWEDNSWAHYPTRRYYQNPYRASTQGEWQTLPATKPEAWYGCLDQRAISGDNPPGLSAALPATTPFETASFVMTFYTPMLSRANNRPSNNRSDHPRVAYECHGDDPRDTSQQEVCYSDATLYPRSKAPQYECRTVSTSSFYTPAIMPLTTDMDAVKSKIQGLETKGQATNSTLGVAWGHRLLASSWRTVWGDATHPVDQAEGVQKALVLLTDGEDNYPDKPDNVGANSFTEGQKVIADRRNQACTAAKNDDIKVFTIAAMKESRVGDLGAALTQCSSQADDPNGNYVFINNNTSEDLEDAFRQIARQLVRFRRVY